MLRAAGTVNHLFTNLLGFLCFTWIRKFKVTETLNHLYQRTKSVWLPQNKPRGQSCRTQRKSSDVSHSISRRNTNRPEWVNSCHKIRFKCYKCNARAAQIIWCWGEIQIFDLWFFIKSEHTLRHVLRCYEHSHNFPELFLKVMWMLEQNIECSDNIINIWYMLLLCWEESVYSVL